MRKGRHPEDGLHVRCAATRHLGHGLRNARLRIAILLATLLALGWQSVLLETHRHALPSVATNVSAKARPAGAVGKHDPSKAPDDCPICRDLANAAYDLPPALVAFGAPLLAIATVLASLGLCLTIRRRPHGWRSRAPPFPL